MYHLLKLLLKGSEVWCHNKSAQVVFKTIQTWGWEHVERIWILSFISFFVIRLQRILKNILLLNCSTHPQKAERMQNMSEECLLLQTLKKVPFPPPTVSYCLIPFVILIHYYCGISMIYANTFLLGLPDSITICYTHCNSLGQLVSTPQNPGRTASWAVVPTSGILWISFLKLLTKLEPSEAHW